MRVCVAQVFAALLLFTFDSAAQPQATTQGLEASVVDDLADAARLASVEVSGKRTQDFVAISSKQAALVGQVYKDIPRDVRVERLAAYFRAKDSGAGLGPAWGFDDFNWGYVKRDLSYVPMKVNADKSARLAAVELGGETYSFERIDARPGRFVVIPTDAKTPNQSTTAIFDVGPKKLAWTGQPGIGDIAVATATTSKGCEIYVSSVPEQAIVLFNGASWYEKTNTSTVRDPGPIEVTVRMAGYEDWTSKRTLTPGASWTINAVLKKRVK